MFEPRSATQEELNQIMQQNNFGKTRTSPHWAVWEKVNIVSMKLKEVVTISVENKLAFGFVRTQLCRFAKKYDADYKTKVLMNGDLIIMCEKEPGKLPVDTMIVGAPPVRIAIPQAQTEPQPPIYQPEVTEPVLKPSKDEFADWISKQAPGWSFEYQAGIHGTTPVSTIAQWTDELDEIVATIHEGQNKIKLEYIE